MRILLAAIGSASLVVVAACSGGAGTGTVIHGGPDQTPPPNTVDSPGQNGDSPGNSGQDSPGRSNQDPSGLPHVDPPDSCVDCSGAYRCVGSVGATRVDNDYQLFGAGAYCVAVDGSNGGLVFVLQCGGPLLDTTGTVSGHWVESGPGHYVVTVSSAGSTGSLDCTVTQQQQQQPQPGDQTRDAG